MADKKYYAEHNVSYAHVSSVLMVQWVHVQSSLNLPARPKLLCTQHFGAYTTCIIKSVTIIRILEIELRVNFVYLLLSLYVHCMSHKLICCAKHY